MGIRSRYLSDEDAARLYAEFPHLKASPEDYCPTCDKTGRYFWKGVAHICNCEEQLQLHKHYLRAGIGVSYQRLSWDDYEGDEGLHRLVEAYLKGHSNYVNRGVGILLHGGYGTGKTFALMMLLKDLIKLGYDCYSTTFASMVEMFTAGWKSVEDKQYFQERIVLCPVLFLDDVGKELKTRTKLSESTFDDVLRRRVQSGRPTFITTNMTKGELSEGYGGAILSLLREVSMAYEVQGADYRPRANDRMMTEVLHGEFRPIF